MLEKERELYAAHLQEWTSVYAGKFVAIKGEDVIGFFDVPEDALSAGAARYGLSSFLVRSVGEEEGAVTIPALTLGVLHANP